jgi:hypothetical protein
VFGGADDLVSRVWLSSWSYNQVVYLERRDQVVEPGTEHCV